MALLLDGGAATGALRRVRHGARTRRASSRLTSEPACAASAEPVLHADVSSTKVVVFSAAPYVLEYLEAPLRLRFPLATFVESRLNKSCAKLAAGADVVCLFVNDDADDAVLAELQAAGVKLIALRCAGFDRVDLAAAAARGISVVRVPSYSPRAVAEHAVALTLCLNRSLHKAYARVREGNYTLNGLTGFNLHEKTVGILGTGSIGTITGSIFAHGFGCNVLGYDVYPNDAFRSVGEYVSLAELVSRSDIISLHAPLNDSTRHIIGPEQVAQCKRGVFIINTSRGGLIDTRAVIDGLESGQIGALGMDVYDKEAALFFKDFSVLSRTKRMRDWDEQIAILLSLPNVIVTPHSAFLTTEALSSIAETTVDNIAAWARGEELVNRVRPAIR